MQQSEQLWRMAMMGRRRFAMVVEANNKCIDGLRRELQWPGWGFVISCTANVPQKNSSMEWDR